jgi:hypothetical protein
VGFGSRRRQCALHGIPQAREADSEAWADAAVWDAGVSRIGHNGGPPLINEREVRANVIRREIRVLQEAAVRAANVRVRVWMNSQDERRFFPSRLEKNQRDADLLARVRAHMTADEMAKRRAQIEWLERKLERLGGKLLQVRGRPMSASVILDSENA